MPQAHKTSSNLQQGPASCNTSFQRANQLINKTAMEMALLLSSFLHSLLLVLPTLTGPCLQGPGGKMSRFTN